ncbi:MAG: nucleotide exchange factor GrpE [Oscillospiraceae bacterium]|nr:nucleotide exchange factor GrpE [Oscillospiraceae bacterium]
MAKEPIAQEPLEDTLEVPEEENLPPEEAFQAELKAQKEQYLRLAAEYDNYRKRSAKEREFLSCLIKGDTVAELLPVADNLARALAAEGSEDDLRKGLELTMTQLSASFEKLGVAAFGEPGDLFDPNLHNAVLHIESDDFGENTVAAVFQQGYRLADTIIRHATVQVAN